MSDGNKEVLLLQDASGEYYAVPRRAIERYRVPAEHRDAIQRLRGRRPAQWLPGTRSNLGSVSTLFGRFDRTPPDGGPPPGRRGGE